MTKANIRLKKLTIGKAWVKLGVKNILSYVPGTVFTGEEIREWIQAHLEGDPKKEKIARGMYRYLNTLKDDEKYEVFKSQERSSANYGQYLVRKHNNKKVWAGKKETGSTTPG